MPRVHIDVMLKEEILDPQGQAVERALPSLGFGGVTSVRIGKHIELDLDDGADLDERVTAIADRLLANPVIERFTYRVEPGDGRGPASADTDAERAWGRADARGAGEDPAGRAAPSRRT